MTSRSNCAIAPFSHFAKVALIAGGALGGLSVEPTYGGPPNGQVVHGDVTFVRNGHRTFIYASNGSIINYPHFNIDANEVVRFIQPGEMARVLNRVTGNDPSIIAGRLYANGQVYIVNPAGVAFVNGSIVNVGGLYAAAGSISDAKFLAGVDQFTNLNGSVINHGTIRGGQVHLLGEHVANHGTIRSPHGLITMVAGDHVILSRVGERVSVKVDGKTLTQQNYPKHGKTTPDMSADPGVENTGLVRSKHGEVFLGAGDMYSLAVRNSGSVEAGKGMVTVAAADGLIHNTADGVINADRIKGHAGDVVVQGPSILNAGRISADTQYGHAGTVEVTSRKHTYLTDGSMISAAGGAQKSHGGDVLVHSYNGQTVMASNATVDVSGGDQGGHGGFAEVSGKGLTFNGKAKLEAMPNFKAGKLLLDPHNIVINDTGGDDSFLDDGFISFDEGGTDYNAYINVDTFKNIVGDIVLEATGSIYVGQSPGDDYQLVVNHNNNITLLAEKVITVRIPIIGANNVAMHADTDGNHYGWVSINVPLQFSGNAEFSGTDIYLQGHSLQTGGWQHYLSRTHLGTDYVLTGTHINFYSTLDSNPDALNKSLTAFGNVNFMDAVGSMRELRFIDITGETQIDGGYVQTNLGQRYNGPTIIGTDTQLVSTNGGDIRFEDKLNAADQGGKAIAGAPGPNVHLVVNTAGTTVFNGVTGGITPFASITTDAPGQTELGGSMFAGDIDFNDPVDLTSDVEINGFNSVEFSQLLDGNFHDLTVNSPTTNFLGVAYKLDHLITDADGTTYVANNIAAQKINFNDPVQLIGNSVISGLDYIDFDQTVDGHFDLTTFSERQVRFGGNVGGNEALASLTTSVGPRNLINKNLVLIDGNLVRATGDITFELDSREVPATVATIAARNMSGVTIESTGGDVYMGYNEKLTSLGDLTIRALNGQATLGDLNAVGDLKVFSPNIAVWARDGGSIPTFDGKFIDDPEVDFVAGGSLIFSSTPTLIGSGGEPIFATTSGQGFSIWVGGFEKRAWKDLTAAMFTRNGTVLDLQPAEPIVPPPPPPPPPPTPRDGLATALPGPTRVEHFVPRDPFALRSMGQLAINMRAPRGDEETPSGRELLNDTAAPGTSPDELAIATNRLRRESVLKSLDLYDALFTAPGGTGMGDETAQQDQVPLIRAALDRAWTAYVAQNPEADPAGLRTFLADDGQHPDALAYVDGLSSLFRELWVMGLTKLELRHSLNRVLGPVTPESMNQSNLERAIGINQWD